MERDIERKEGMSYVDTQKIKNKNRNKNCCRYNLGCFYNRGQKNYGLKNSKHNKLSR